MATKVEQVLINHTDTAAIVGVPNRTIFRWAKERTGGFPLPVRVMGRTYLFNRSEVLAWAGATPSGRQRRPKDHAPG